MSFTTHIPIKMYFDTKNKVLESASYFTKRTGLMPYFHKERFVFVGAWQCNQNFPFLNSKKTKILRWYYNELQTLMEV